MNSDNKEYNIICEGEIGSKCDGINDTKSCNQDFNYQCANWVTNQSDIFEPAGYKC